MGILKRPKRGPPGFTWYIQYTLNGKQVQEAVKWAKTKSQAEAALKKKQSEIKEQQARGFWGGGITDATVSEMCAHFLEYSKQHKRSWNRDEGLVKRIVEHFGDRRAASITPTDIRKYIARRQGDTWKEKPIKPSTINKELTCLKTAFNHYIKDGRLAVNPVSMVKKLKEDNERDRVLDADEYERYMLEAPGWLRVMAKIACYTGMRRGELLGLTWDRVDLRGGWISLKGKDTKTGEARTVPLADTLQRELKAILGGAVGAIGPVFIRPDGKPVDKFFLAYHHKAVCKRAGIEGFTWHDWRHCFVTMARKAGKQDRSIMKVVGHKTDSMLKRYDKVDREDLVAVVDGLDMTPERNGKNSGGTSSAS